MISVALVTSWTTEIILATITKMSKQKAPTLSKKM